MKTDGHYSLPSDNEIERQEVAFQEIGLLDLYCQRRVHRSRGGRSRHKRGAGRSRRVACRCSRRGARRRSRGCGSRSCRRRKGRCGCGGSGRRVHDGTTGSRIDPILDADKLTDRSIGLDRTASGVIGGTERTKLSNMPSEQWDRSVPLSC